MKNLFLVFILCCSISAFSQEKVEETKPTDKGSFLINGSFNFNSSNTDFENNFAEETSRFSFSLSPRAGYFVLDGLALGLEANLGYTWNETEFADSSTQISNTTSYSVGPFVRYYFKNGLFAETSIGFGQQNTDIDDQFSGREVELEFDFFSYELGVGYAIFFNNSVSLEPFLSYQFDRRTQSENDTDTTGLNLGVGFTYYF